MALDYGYIDSPAEKEAQLKPNSAITFNQVDENNVLEYLGSKNDAASQDYLIKYYLDKLSENSARS